MTLLLVLFSELGGDSDESDDDSGEDDLLGGADDGLMGDDMFGDDGGGGSSDEEELNYQLDEIEKEVDSLSNKVETVRGENEQISDSIETVERNVDKLVDLYEIVTHGINPFVDEQEIGDAFETATGQAGLIGNDPEDAIDEEIASAEAEDFLDDDDMPFEDDDTDDLGTDFEDDADEPIEEDVVEEDPLEEDALAEEIGDEDGFADGDALEAEGEPLEADGVDEMPDDEDDDLTRFLPDEDEADEGVIDEGEVDEGVADGDSVDDTEIDSVGEDESFEAGPEPELGGSEPAVQTSSGPGAVESPPYLDTHPSGYTAEITTLEWLEFLVETAGVAGAAQTVAYYRSVGWISDAVETYLHRLLAGFGDERTLPPEDPDPQSILRTDDHKRSLQYIAQIATPERQTGLVDATGGEVVAQSASSSEPSPDLDDVEPIDDDGLAAESIETESVGAIGNEVDSTENADSVSIDDMKPDPLEDQGTASMDDGQTNEVDGTEAVDGRPDGADDRDLEEW